MKKLFILLLIFILCPFSAIAQMGDLYTDDVEQNSCVKNKETRPSEINLNLSQPSKSYNLQRKEIKNPDTDKYKNYDDGNDIDDTPLINPRLNPLFNLDRNILRQDY